MASGEEKHGRQQQLPAHLCDDQHPAYQCDDDLLWPPVSGAAPAAESGWASEGDATSRVYSEADGEGSVVPSSVAAPSDHATTSEEQSSVAEPSREDDGPSEVSHFDRSRGPFTPSSMAPCTFLNDRPERPKKQKAHSRTTRPSAVRRSLATDWQSEPVTFAASLWEPMFQEVPDPEIDKTWLPPSARTTPVVMRHVTTRPTFPMSPARRTRAGRLFRFFSESDVATGSWRVRQQKRVRVLVDSRLFVLLTCTLIVINAVLISLEQAAFLTDETLRYLHDMKYFFFFTFTIEIIARIFGHGLSHIREDAWVKFDLFVLFFELLGEFVLPNYIRTGEALILIRVMRLSPLARTLRPIARFRVLKVLVKSLLASTGIVVNTVLLLILFLYVFAIVGHEVIGMHPDVLDPEAEGSEFRDIVSKYFPNIQTTMLTLIQFICLDSVGAIYRPLVLHDKRLLVYFIAVILVIPILLMNLVTGVIVSNTQEHIEQDKAEALKFSKSQLAKEFRAVFNRLDEDKSGQVSREELSSISDEDKALLKQSTCIGDPMTIFKALDPEEVGTLDMEDFCNGIWHLATSKATISEQTMEKQVTVALWRLGRIQDGESKLQSSLERARTLQRRLLESLRSGPRGGSGCSHAHGGPGLDSACGSSQRLAHVTPSCLGGTRRHRVSSRAHSW